MKNKKYIYSFAILAILATVGFSGLAYAQTTDSPTPGNGAWGLGHKGGPGGGMMRPGVFGTVTAVNGNTITITSIHRIGGRPPQGSTTTTTPTTTTTTYTVDATNAKITKSNIAGTISSIVVGDTIVAQGTLTGTNLVATTIRDGLMMRTPGANGNQNQISPITGNGQPVIAGTVTTINGNTLTITNKSDVTYTVDVASAKIVEGKNTVTISNVTVGDNVIVQGTINGTSVTASSVIDQKVNITKTPQPRHQGFFGSIGSFFSHLFGF